MRLTTLEERNLLGRDQFAMRSDHASYPVLRRLLLNDGCGDATYSFVLTVNLCLLTERTISSTLRLPGARAGN